MANWSGWGFSGYDPFTSILEGGVNSAFSRSAARYNAKLQYKYAERYAKNSPSWAKQGLTSAGYNPMLAISGATSSPTVVPINNSFPPSNSEGGVDNSAFQSQKNASKAQKNDLKLQEMGADKLGAEVASIRANTVADVALKRAQVERLNKESASIAPSARSAHDYISAVKDVVAPVLQAAATAYGAKKGVEIATKAMKKVGIKNAREVAKESVKASVSNSAKSALGVAAKTVSKAITPAVGYYGGKYGADVSKRRYELQRGKSWSTIFSKRPLTH